MTATTLPTASDAVRSSNLRDMLVDIPLLLLATWACHFLLASHFGLYEDDWSRVPVAADISLTALSGLLKDFLTFRIGEGRPLHDCFVYLFSFIGWRLGGLEAIYWLAYAILALNVTLLYWFLRRMSGDRLLALSGTLAFILFPADTTRPFLTHALGVQPSLSFLLLACHTYLSGRRALSYFLATLCLMSYETFFLVFLSMPLVRARWDRKTLIGLVKHGLLLGTILLAVFLLRKLTGEERVVDLTARYMLVNSLNAMTYGPIVSMAQYLRGPLRLATYLGTNISAELCIVALLSGAAFSWRFYQSMHKLSLEDLPSSSMRGRLLHLEAPLPLLDKGKTAVLGIVMLVLAYPLVLTTSPWAMSGKETRAHSAAAFGAAVILGALSSACAFVCKLYGRERIAALGLGVGTALLAGTSFCVQSDYSLSWSLQRNFWTQFVHLSPTLSAGAVFLVDPLEVKNTTQILAFSVSTPWVLERIYRFPDSWRTPGVSAKQRLHGPSLPPPRVFLFGEQWRARYCSGEELLSSGNVTRYWPYFANYGTSPPQARLVRITDNVLSLYNPPCSCTTVAKPMVAETAKTVELAKRPLYNYLIR